MRNLKPTKEAAKFVENLPPKQFRQVWLKVLSLLQNPFPNDSEQISGFPFHRVDIGEYRIIYEATENEVELIVIGKRNDDHVYKKLKRKT